MEPLPRLKDRGLRFFAASHPRGDPGQRRPGQLLQRNRSLSGMLRSWSASHKGLVSKAFMLPPIEGTGMADDPEVKALMKLKGLESAFVHADEFAQMFCRELLLGPAQQSWVILARTFPSVKKTMVEAKESSEDKASSSAGGIRLEQRDLPLIGTVETLDLKAGELVAKRTFRGLRPLDRRSQAFQAPKASSSLRIMAVETFLEAAHLLYPHLNVLGVRRLNFKDILECPPDTGREARILCRREEDPSHEVRCHVELSSAGLSPSGRSWTPGPRTILDRSFSGPGSPLFPLA